MKSKQSNWTIPLLVTAAIILSICTYKAGNDEKEELKKYPGETIGIIYKYGSDAKGHSHVDYYYLVDGKKYKDFSMLKKFGDSQFDTSHIGEKYTVIYSTRNPKINQIDFDRPQE
ncbi:hypothetical protein QTN47_25775 [Danxiaibacter flavus]|uniref:DUF1093 domain-containing protein n=1 Tax=Danxiaibacter flavus TaxID=3049108 RepID=A0ABV3ZN80_9BACT|nr:hypothetical protein QNM32_25775 [Chitinophagaceae bacterium DXS]